MTTPRSNHSSVSRQPSGDEPLQPPTFDPYARIIETARESGSLHQLYLGFLRVVLQALGSPFAALDVNTGSDVFKESAHDGSTDPNFWKSHIQGFLTESLTSEKPRAKLLNPRKGPNKIAFLSCPILGRERERIGTLAAVVPCTAATEVPYQSDRLTALVEFASGAAALIHSPVPKDSAALQNSALGRIGHVTSPHELAFSITNSLRNKLGCEQVVLAFVKRKRIQLLSISGQDHVTHQSGGVRSIEAAMEECFDAGEIISVGTQDLQADSPQHFRLHQEWHAAANGDAVASVPLTSNERIVAVISIRCRQAEMPNRDRFIEIQERVEAYVPALILARRATRSLPRHACENIYETTATLFSAGNWGKKLLAASLAAVLGWCVFGSMDHHLTVSCILDPETSRYVSAPYDGMLSAVSAKTGDLVTAGQVLARFDQRELLKQRASLAAEIDVLDTKHNRALAADDPVEAQLTQVNRKLQRTRLDLLDDRIEQSAIRAPIDGIVVSGDLEDQIGNILERGRPLFRIAPPEQWNVVLRIPESDAEHILDGATGVFIPYARPESSERIRINRIRPAAEIHNERNVIIAEAHGDLPFDWLRPGMEGAARIDAGRKPVWWILFHKFIDWLRVRFWL
jgi:hypothetical protein